MNKSDVLVLLDNGHGIDTPGKCSPVLPVKLQEKGYLRLFEYQYAREIVSRIKECLIKENILYSLICPELKDKSLTDRVNLANNLYQKQKKLEKIAIFISVHVNASGNGNWMSATGWSCYTSKGQTQGDKLADKLYEAASEILSKKNIKIRTDYSDKDPDYELNFTVLKRTQCPAVLTENLFMDNLDDVEYLLSEEGKHDITNIHVLGIKKYIESL